MGDGHRARIRPSSSFESETLSRLSLMAPCRGHPIKRIRGENDRSQGKEGSELTYRDKSRDPRKGQTVRKISIFHITLRNRSRRKERVMAHDSGGKRGVA